MTLMVSCNLLLYFMWSYKEKKNILDYTTPTKNNKKWESHTYLDDINVCHLSIVFFRLKSSQSHFSISLIWGKYCLCQGGFSLTLCYTTPKIFETRKFLSQNVYDPKFVTWMFLLYKKGFDWRHKSPHTFPEAL